MGAYSSTLSDLQGGEGLKSQYLFNLCMFTEHLQAYHLVDAKWWSDQAVILARGTGSVTLSSVQTLKNLLGTSPEWFEPAPIITSAKDESFLGLEVC